MLVIDIVNIRKAITTINDRLKKRSCTHQHKPYEERYHCVDPEIYLWEKQQLMRCHCGDEYWTKKHEEKKKWLCPNHPQRPTP